MRGFVFEDAIRFRLATQQEDTAAKIQVFFGVLAGVLLRWIVVDLIKNREVALIINTSLGQVARRDEQEIRRAALQYNVPCVTTMTGARALVETITAHNCLDFDNVRALQELHAVEHLAVA